MISLNGAVTTTFTLEVHYDQEGVGPSAFSIDITPPLAKQLLTRMDLFTKLKTKDGDLSDLVYHPPEHAWLKGEWAGEAGESPFRQEDDGEEFPLTEEYDSTVVRMEYTKMMLDAEHISFRGYVAHTDVVCSTGQITREQLHKVKENHGG